MSSPDCLLNPKPKPKKEHALLTVTNVIPVGPGKEGVAAQTLKLQSLFLATQQTLNQIKELTANFGVIRKLQKPLFKKTKNKKKIFLKLFP